MNISSRYNVENLHNRTMEIVLRKAGSFLDQRTDFCRCEQCVLDLVAFTLNHTTPLFGTSLLDPLNADRRLLAKVEIEVEVALEEGARRICRHPSHVEEEGTHGQA